MSPALAWFLIVAGCVAFWIGVVWAIGALL
jgi:hypothetical protein